MRNLFLLAILGFFITGLAFAGAPLTDPSVTLTTRVWSGKLLPLGKVSFRGPVVNNDLMVKWGNGFYLNPGLTQNGSLSLSDSPAEFDLFAGWAGKAGKLTVDASIGLISFRPIFGLNKGDFIDYGFEIGYPIRAGKRHTLTPYVKVDVCRFVQKSQADGTMTRVGLKDSWKMGKKVSLDQKVFVTQISDGLGGLRESRNAQYHADLKWKIGKNSTLILPAIQVNRQFEDLHDGRRNEFVIGAGFQIKF